MGKVVIGWVKKELNKKKLRLWICEFYFWELLEVEEEKKEQKDQKSYTFFLEKISNFIHSKTNWLSHSSEMDEND